jgi:hypothetical protein
MLIKARDLRGAPDLLAVARELAKYAKTAIWVASDLMRAT